VLKRSRSTTLWRRTSARDVMGEPALRVIAHELVQVIKANVSIDWMHRTSARQHPAARQAPVAQIWLSARPSGRCSSKCSAASGGAFGRMGRLSSPQSGNHTHVTDTIGAWLTVRSPHGPHRGSSALSGMEPFSQPQRPASKPSRRGAEAVQSGFGPSPPPRRMRRRRRD
jgi:hypothetical protein